MLKSPLKPPIEGLLIIGTRAGCGKTILATGITAALMHNGIQTQVMCPLVFCHGARVGLAPQAKNAQKYMDEIARQVSIPASMVLESPFQMTQGLWDRLLSQCRQSLLPVVIEAPGTAASPIFWQNISGRPQQNQSYAGAGQLFSPPAVPDNHYFFDAIDLARELGIPVLLVTPKSAEVIEDTAPMLTYLKQVRQANVIGWVAVETQPPTAVDLDWQSKCLYLTQQYEVVYLGELPYSPSISVERRQQGNLITLIEQHVDLFPIQMGLRVKV